WAVSPYGAGILFQCLTQGQTGLATALAHLLGSQDAVNLMARAWIVELLAIGNAWNLAPLRFTLFVFTCIITVLSLRTFDYIYTMSRGGPGDASEVLTYQLYKISF